MKALAAWFFGTVIWILWSENSSAQENLLTNGDFESGGKGVASSWNQIYPRQIAQPPPVYEVHTDDVHGGKRCVSITTEYARGYTSYTQTLSNPPRGAKSVHFEGWLRMEPAESGATGAASLMIFFSRKEGGGEMRATPEVKLAEEWQHVEFESMIPEGATTWHVRCGIAGAGRAFFDDVRLTVSRENLELVSTALAVAHGDYKAEAKQNVKDPWILLSIPFPFGGQSPLAVRVSSKPEGAVAGLRVEKDQENRPLKVHLQPMSRGDVVSIRVETLALLRDRELSVGEGVSVKSRRLPKEIRPHLKPAAGIDSESKPVKGIAHDFRKDDLASLMGDLAAFLEEHMEYAGGKGQGADECIASGKAVCTGYANVAASLLIASEVPARVLACTALGGRLQEHYIVEAWTSELGWSRMESTMARFPWGDSKNLVLRIVYPDAFRSQVDVPLFSGVASGLSGGFDMGEDTCWQGGDLLQAGALKREEIDVLEARARIGFEALVKKKAKGDRVSFLGDAASLKLGKRGKKLLQQIADW